MGKEIRCNSKASKMEEIKKFEAGNFELKPYRTWYYQSNLPYPWYKVCKIIMKYITLDDHHTKLFGTHIIMLNHF